METRIERQAATEVVIDRENLFLLYATFTGDVERVAHASGIRPVDVLKVADECGWNEKLAAILKLKKSSRPGDVERGINRGLNYAQCHKLRLFLERVIRKISAFTDEELDSYIFTAPDKEGNPVSKMTTRALADLASSVEKCQAMSYQALSDTAQDRAKRDESLADGDSGGAIHAQIQAAMSAVGKDNSPRALLVDAQLENAHAIVVESTKKVLPYDKD